MNKTNLLLAFTAVTFVTNEFRWDNAQPNRIAGSGYTIGGPVNPSQGWIYQTVLSNFNGYIVLPDGKTNQYALSSVAILERQLDWSNHTTVSWTTNEWKKPGLPFGIYTNNIFIK